MFLILLLCVIALLTVHSYITLVIDSKKTNVSGPFLLPFIGSGYIFLGDPAKIMQTMEMLCIKYKSAALFYILKNRYVLCTHPTVIETVLTTPVKGSKGSTYDILTPWLGQGLLTSVGTKWKNHRRFLTPAFHYVILQSFLPTILKNKDILIENLRQIADDGPHDIFRTITLASLDIITESIMGTSVNAQKKGKSEYVEAIESISYVIARKIQNPLSKIFYNISHLRVMQEKALEVLHRTTKNVIESRRKELKNADVSKINYDAEHGMKNKNMFLDLLLLGEVDGEKIDDQSVMDEVNTFLFEGHDTTASAVSFCLYALSKNKRLQEKILEEQKSIFGNDLTRDPDYDELKKMKYLELVIKESLRIYPSVPLIERKLSEDMNVAGFHLTKDTNMIFNIFALHRNPEVYEDPLEFRPERFETPQKCAFNWIPFSAGPRNCIGQKFAMMEMKVILSSIVKNLILLPSGVEPIIYADLVLRPQNGILVKLQQRSI